MELLTPYEPCGVFFKIFVINELKKVFDMDITIQPGKLSGVLHAIPSKSQAHRYMICAAFAASSTSLICPETNRDLEATADCLRALGAEILRTESGYRITAIQHIPESATLNCRESGSTLRFLLPIVGALGVDATFQMEGRLPQRPLSPLWEEMERKGCTLSRPSENTLRCSGQLQAGQYSIDGSVSSQFITGLLFALPLIDGKTQLSVTGKLESKPYVTMTDHALKLFQYPRSPSPGSYFIILPSCLLTQQFGKNSLGCTSSVRGSSRVRVIHSACRDGKELLIHFWEIPRPNLPGAPHPVSG